MTIITTLHDRTAQYKAMVGTLPSAELVVVVDKNVGGILAVVAAAKLPFNLGRWRNVGAAKAGTDELFFCDVDMLLPPIFLAEYNARVKPGVVWFPECRNIKQDGTVESGWRASGYGNCGIMREDFEKAGRYSEEFTRWGKEDTDFRQRCEKAGLEIIRDQLPGFFHQWHSTDPEFLNKHRGQA